MKILKIAMCTIIFLSACSPKQQGSILQMETKRIGNWTIYTAPEWTRQKEPVYISSIAVSADGSLWFGTTGGGISVGTGAYRFDGKRWSRFTSQNSGLPSDEISSVAASPDSTIWFTSFCCGIAHFDGTIWKQYTMENGLGSNDVRSSIVAPDGSLWLGNEEYGILHFKGNQWTTYTVRDGLSANWAGHIEILPDNSLLFSVSSGGQARLNLYDENEWRIFPTTDKLTQTYTFDVAISSDRTMWFATEKYGVFSFSNGSWVNYTMKDGLAGDSVCCVVAENDGDMWFGTDKGISRFDGKSWENFTTGSGLPNNWIGSVAIELDGTLWFGSASAIYRYQPSK
ncbi:MAG: hypothetical protein HKUEN02_20050 [Anaerolineaceae bacterium]|nr:MAG: hypothetical protein HKUEN02_20050 [Anaerolineaceae bacterium]